MIKCVRFWLPALFSYLCGSPQSTVYMVKVTRRGLLVTVIIILIAGKLLARVFPLAGAVIEMAALAVYLVFRARRTVDTVKRFKMADDREKVRVGVWFGILLIAVNMIVKMFTGGDTGFFLVLVLLMVDELSYPKMQRR